MYAPTNGIDRDSQFRRSRPTNAKRLCLLAFFVLTVGLVLPLPGLGAQDADLTLQPAIGTTFSVAYTHETTQVTEVQGKSIDMKYEMGMEMEWDVDEIDGDGVISMTQRFTRFRIAMSSTDVDPIEFDSASEERVSGYAYELSKTLTPLLNADFSVKMNQRGEIVSVALPVETMDAIREAPGSMDLRKLLTKDGINETLSSSLTVLPEEPVADGAEWRAARTSELSQGALDQKQTYTYVGMEEVEGTQLHRIDVETELNFRQPEDDVKAPQSIKSQSHSGSIWIDPETRMFSGSEFKSELVTETPYRESLIETNAVGSFSLSISVKEE